MGGVKGEELGLPGPHGASQPGQLRDLDTIAPVVEADQGGAGGWRANRCIHGPEQLFALPGRGPLTTRISSRQPSPQPHSSSAGELLGRGQQQLADAIQRIALAAPMPEGGLLGPPADLVEHRVGQPDGMKVVHHPGVAERCDQGAGIAPRSRWTRRGSLGAQVVMRVPSGFVRTRPPAPLRRCRGGRKCVRGRVRR
jgi:hypothetical protein